MKCRFWLLTMAYGATVPVLAQDLQTVTGNGNTTTLNIQIDPNANAFRSFAVKRNVGLTTAKSQMALANNETVGAITWHPDIANINTQYGIMLGANRLDFYNNGTYHGIWHAGKMGPNSGLDADMVDGVHASGLLRYGLYGADPLAYEYPAPGIYYNALTLPANGIPENNYGVYTYLGDMVPNRDYKGIMAMGANNGSLYTIRKVQGVWETSWKKVWDSGNFTPGNYLALAGGTLTGALTIGTTTAQRDLNVNGNIKTRKVKVTVAEWPDYVFAKGYPLMPLSELGAYIAEHQHLPEVPSAETVQQEGLELGANQAVLLKKIEELTLYILEQHKRQEQLEKRIAELEKKP